jgi:hypothetical protein
MAAIPRDESDERMLARARASSAAATSAPAPVAAPASRYNPLSGMVSTPPPPVAKPEVIAPLPAPVAKPTATQLAKQVKNIINDMPAQSVELNKIIAEAQAAIEGVNTAGAGIAGFTPITTVVPGPTGGTALIPERMLASDTFRNTFSLAFGKEEASKAYVGELYKLVSGFYKTGSTVDESINLAVRQARVDKTIPEFTKRFEGLFSLDDMLAAGKLVDVPTVAEFIQSENEAAQLLREAGMPDLATTEFVGTKVLGKGKSVAEIGRILNNAFYAIDNASAEEKKVLAENFPTATRSGLAAALIGGERGAAQLQKEIAGYKIVAAARSQGITTDLAKGMDYAAQGQTFATAKVGFGQVAAATDAYQKILEIQGKVPVKTAEVQASLQKAILDKDITEQEKMRKAAEREAASYQGRAGNIGSKAFASQTRGSGIV